MKMATLTLDKLPARSAFGKTELYKPDDVAEYLSALKRHVAVSNSENYPTRDKARNAAGTLRARIKKMNPELGGTTYTQIIENKSKTGATSTWTFWIVPPPAQG